MKFTPNLQIWINKGTAFESYEKMGIAHLAEHIIFRTRERLTGKLLVNKLYSLKIKINAYTTHSHTVFILSGNEVINPQVDIIINAMFLEPYFTSDDLIVEKRVIKNEIEEAQNSFRLSIMKFLRSIEGQYWGYDLLGDKKKVAAFKKAHVLNYFKSTFVKKNITTYLTTESLPVFKSSRKLSGLFKKGVKSLYSDFDQDTQFTHCILKISNLKQYAAYLIFQDYLQQFGHRSLLIFNKQVQIAVVSAYQRKIETQTLLDIMNTCTYKHFKKLKQNLELAFMRDHETGGDFFHEAEWRQEFGEKNSYESFRRYLFRLSHKDFLNSLSDLLRPTSLNAAFNSDVPLGHFENDMMKSNHMLCFTLIVPFGYYDENLSSLGLAFAMSETLTIKMQAAFDDEKIRITPEFSHDHYGVTLWGVGNSKNIKLNAIKMFRNPVLSTAEMDLLVNKLNRKASFQKRMDAFEVKSDDVFYYALNINCNRYPVKPYTQSYFKKLLVKHMKLAQKSMINTSAAHSFKGRKNRAKSTIKTKVFCHKREDGKADYLVYFSLPEEYQSFNQITDLSAYINREEFDLFNRMKYELGFFYSFKVKLQKVCGSFFLKIKFTSSLENKNKIKDFLKGFNLNDDLKNSEGYYTSGNDIFTKNRERLLKLLLCK